MREKALELLKMFKDNGYEAYVVGGFVRDYVLGKQSVDVDICTNATPKEIQSIFSETNVSISNYGSVHVNYKKVNFEITTYRMDIEYKDGRNPSKIMYTDKLIIDLKRRDFTMNTLCMDDRGNVIDLLDSKKDIENRIIKTVGDADKRFKEDALRILRAVRFATELDFKLDGHLEVAIANNAHLVEQLSYYRKKQELNRIFSSVNAINGIILLRRFGLDKYLDINLDKEIVKTSDPLGMWAQVEASDKYQFTSNEIDYLKAISRVLKDKKINDVELYHNGNYVCYIAAQILNIKEVNIYDRYDNLPIKKSSDICLNGKDIIDILNIKDKFNVKIIINDLEEKIIDRKLDNNKEILTKYIIDTYKDIML